ncbi:MAG: mxaD protein [Paraglaciecola sp.]|jgi:mxaD protein
MLNTIIKITLSAALLATAMTNFADDLNVSKEVTVNASADVTWKMIGNFNHLDVWHSVVISSELTHGKSNAERLLTVDNGATITEKQVSRNDKQRSYTYAITASPLPVADYVSTISVQAIADGKSTVKWTSSFDAKGATDEEAINTIAGIYDAGLNSLDKHFNQ